MPGQDGGVAVGACLFGFCPLELAVYLCLVVLIIQSVRTCRVVCACDRGTIMHTPGMVPSVPCSELSCTNMHVRGSYLCDTHTHTHVACHRLEVGAANRHSTHHPRSPTTQTMSMCTPPHPPTPNSRITHLPSTCSLWRGRPSKPSLRRS